MFSVADPGEVVTRQSKTPPAAQFLVDGDLLTHQQLSVKTALGGPDFNDKFGELALDRSPFIDQSADPLPPTFSFDKTDRRGKDRHKRTLGGVFVDVDGQTVDVNARMVAQGFGCHYYTRYSKDRNSRGPSKPPDASPGACGRTPSRCRR